MSAVSSGNSGVINYPHTIFTPTTGQTITLLRNQMNVVNPAGAILALTMNFPSTPQNNDVVFIKFTQAITTLTVAVGTILGSPSSTAISTTLIFTYDSSTNTWY